MKNEYSYFLESNSVGVSRLFIVVYSNRDNNLEKLYLKILPINSQ